MIKRTAVLAFFCLCLLALISNKPISSPELIVENEMARVRFQKNSEENTEAMGTNILWKLEINTPAIDSSRPETLILGDLYLLYAREILSDLRYSSAEEEMDFSLECTFKELSISVTGRNENKAPQLLLDIAAALKTLCLKEEKFKALKSSLLRKYRSTSHDPIDEAYDIFKSVTHRHYATQQQKAVAAKKVTFESLERFAETLFNEIHIEGIVWGLDDKQKGEQTVQELISTLGNRPYTYEKQAKEEINSSPEHGPFFLEAKTKAHSNVALLAIENSPSLPPTWLAHHILIQAMKDSFVNELQKCQSACDLVLCHLEEHDSRLFSILIVSSSTHDARDLLSRIELFLENYNKNIEGQITKNSFEKIKAAAIAKFKESSNKQLTTGLFQRKLDSYDEEECDITTKQIKSLEELTYRSFLKKTHESMDKINKRRIAILLKGNTSEEQSLQYKKCRSIAHMKQVLQLR